MDWLPTKNRINKQHRRHFADIETITIYRNFNIFQYRLGISFGRGNADGLNGVSRHTQFANLLRQAPANRNRTVLHPAEPVFEV